MPPFSFTNPLGFLTDVAEGAADFGGSILDIGTSLFESASPLLGFLSDVGVFGSPDSRVVVQNQNQRPTNPATGEALAQSMDVTGRAAPPLSFTGASFLPAVTGAAKGILPVLTGPTARGIAVGAGLGEVVEGVVDFFGGGGGGRPVSNGALTIQPTASASARWPRTVQALTLTPAGNQRVVTYRNMGAPVLYAGDLAACKRVARARKRLGKR